MAGHREGSMYKEIKRVIPTAAALGSAVLGLLSVFFFWIRTTLRRRRSDCCDRLWYRYHGHYHHLLLHLFPLSKHFLLTDTSRLFC
ncbi:hypothetical protein EI94DRAFT_1729729, partial [Lactarius quietus]